LIIIGSATGVILFAHFSRQIPSIEQIASRQVPQSTKIYDRSGEVLLYEISNGQKRTSISFDDIPEYLKDATTAIEDKNFYEEPGFSVRGIIRAFVTNITNRGIVQGGSTITQQLAKNAFLSADQTIARKAKELILAIQLDRYYSKDEILNLYLNEIPYGPTIYGVEAASQAYFDKPTKELNLAESAVLAALPKAPSYYYPWGSHQEDLFTRQKLVLATMHELGKITSTELEEALEYPIKFAPPNIGIKAPHFVIALQDYLVQKYGEETVRVGGLRVISTLDWDLQQLGERVVAEGAARNEELYEGENAALVAEDPKTGQILAMIGSRDYFDENIDGNFNVATQGLRQPGSALKPFVYMNAFEKGYTPNTVLFDVPTEFDTTNNPDKSYQPENFDDQFRGPVTFRQALSQSINVPAVKALYLVGIKDALNTVESFGISTLNDPRRYGLSLVLGGGEVRLIDMTQAYSTMAQDGIKHTQTMILEIRDGKGNIIESFKNDGGEKVVDPQYPRLINDILSDVDARSGLYSSSLGLTLVAGHDIALKTGTSNDYRDAWVFGYTPSLVIGVWAGNNDNTPMVRRGSSILAALPIWHAFAEEALGGVQAEAFIRPEPATPNNPVLAGSYNPGGQIHTILYFIDKNNPTGPSPQDPNSDSQFKNWEAGVVEWASKNIQNFNNINQSSITNDANYNYSLSGLEIKITRPVAGEFINDSGELPIQARITSSNEDIKNINIYLNGGLVKSFSDNFRKEHWLNWQFMAVNPLPQNLIEVEAITESGLRNRAGVIIFN